MPAAGSEAVVQAVIARDGKLDLSMKSGSEAWDKAALTAVRKAAPFPPQPKAFAHPTVEAHFHIGWVK